MPSYKKCVDFFETDEGRQFKKSLRSMVASDEYNTQPSFSANSALYPDHRISFVDKHIAYLRNHPNTDPQQYLSNLYLMTRIR